MKYTSDDMKEKIIVDIFMQMLNQKDLSFFPANFLYLSQCPFVIDLIYIMLHCLAKKKRRHKNSCRIVLKWWGLDGKLNALTKKKMTFCDVLPFLTGRTLALDVKKKRKKVFPSYLCHQVFHLISSEQDINPADNQKDVG